MNRGRKPKSRAEKVKAGTLQKSRDVYIEPELGGFTEPELPAGLSPAAKKLWVQHVDRFRLRDKPVGNYSSALRWLCESEALLERNIKTGKAKAADFETVRKWLNEFRETPASDVVKKALDGKKENPFTRNLNRHARR